MVVLLKYFIKSCYISRWQLLFTHYVGKRKNYHSSILLSRHYDHFSIQLFKRVTKRTIELNLFTIGIFPTCRAKNVVSKPHLSRLIFLKLDNLL